MENNDIARGGTALLEVLLPPGDEISVIRRRGAPAEVEWEARIGVARERLIGYGPTLAESLANLGATLAEAILSRTVMTLGWTVTGTGALPFPSIVATGDHGHVTFVVATQPDHDRAHAIASGEASGSPSPRVVVVPPEAAGDARELYRATE